MHEHPLLPLLGRSIVTMNARCGADLGKVGL